MLKGFRFNSGLTRNYSFFQARAQPYNGYVVLVPEIGEDNNQLTDKLFQSNGLPAFNNITIEVCLGVIGRQAVAVEECVRKLEDAITKGEKLEPKQIYNKLDEATTALDSTWGITKALYLGRNTLMPTKTYISIHDRARNARASKYSSKPIFDVLTAHNDDNYDEQEKRLRQKFLLEGRLNGLALAEAKNTQLKEVLSKLAQERSNFKSKVNIATHSLAHTIKEPELVKDFPQTLLEALAHNKDNATAGPWKIPMQSQSVEGFLKYCPNRLYRWNVWQAYVRRNSPYLDKNLDTSVHLENIRSLRRRQANLLGFADFAEMSMQTKMVKNVDNLLRVFHNLLKCAGPAQSSEIGRLQKFANECGFVHELEVYDVSYWRQRFLVAEHDWKQEHFREYFPLPQVFKSLCEFSEEYFNIKIIQREDVKAWHSAVKYYEVYDCDIENSSTPVGGLYVDYYSEQHKFGKNNGWTVGIRNRNDSGKHKPLCALIFNFSEPKENRPVLLSYDDLHVLFKTFGTALQHVLTRAKYVDLAGLSNIEWDASQVSGYVMSNFLDNPKILKRMSRHYLTDQAITDELTKKTKLEKTYLAGYSLCQELYVSHLDIELNRSKDWWLDVVRKLWPAYTTLPLDKHDAHPCSMTDIIAGDWGAAYYSHLYSKMIAADITAAFEESSDHAVVGKRYKDTFLGCGGALSALEIFRSFRGRDPSIESLLASSGLKKVETNSDSK